MLSIAEDIQHGCKSLSISSWKGLLCTKLEMIKLFSSLVPALQPADLIWSKLRLELIRSQEIRLDQERTPEKKKTNVHFISNVQLHGCVHEVTFAHKKTTLLSCREAPQRDLTKTLGFCKAVQGFAHILEDLDILLGFVCLFSFPLGKLQSLACGRVEGELMEAPVSIRAGLLNCASF